MVRPGRLCCRRAARATHRPSRDPRRLTHGQMPADSALPGCCFPSLTLRAFNTTFRAQCFGGVAEKCVRPSECGSIVHVSAAALKSVDKRFALCEPRELPLGCGAAGIGHPRPDARTPRRAENSGPSGTQWGERLPNAQRTVPKSPRESLRRNRDHRTTAAPASATAWSCSPEPPLTPIAPTTFPFSFRGIPPANIMIRP